MPKTITEILNEIILLGEQIERQLEEMKQIREDFPRYLKEQSEKHDIN